MRKGVVLILIIFLLAISIVFSQNNNDNKVDKEVEEMLKEQDEVSVIVVLEDDYDILDEYSMYEINEMDDFEKKKMMVEEQQEKVLSELDYEEVSSNKKSIVKKSLKNNKIDLRLKSKFTSVNGFSGEITKEGLEKLNANLHPDVQGAVYNLIAQNSDFNSYKKLLKKYEKTKNIEEKVKPLSALYKFKEKEALKASLKYSLSSKIRIQDLRTVFSTINSNPYYKPLLLSWVKSNWKKLRNLVDNNLVVMLPVSTELDEQWSFVTSKKHQRWLWVAIDHYTGEI